MPMAPQLPYPISFLLLSLLLLLPFSVFPAYGSITPGSSLTANPDNSSWPSFSGDFAFGFREVRAGAYLLAIWFHKIPEKTIVWSANGAALAPQGSTVELTEDGRFLLSDPKGQPIWVPTFSGGPVAYAAMLDSGNFVLVSGSGSNSTTTLWQSFDEPTDTILPSQILNRDGRLVARYAETNYSNGRFELLLQKDGNLVLATTNLPVLDSVNAVYWSPETRCSGYQLIFNESTGYIYVISKDGKILSLVSSVAAPSSQFYQRAIVESDGVFRRYVYPKSAGEKPLAWSVLSLIPSDICLSITQSTGSGVCGFNSYCALGSDQRARCECPSGYAFFDPNDRTSGCKPDFVPQNCDEELRKTELFEFVDMANTDWPLNDYEYYQPVTEEWCRGVCLSDCFCAVAIFREGNCWKKRSPLSNGRIDPSVGGKALIKVRKH
ncbi:G-type lectin S-receptor-like serine/threonine-protein kinase LECRK3 [Diospyros lotus]|uniref:G-type lectin S-receptor-like serine/threonine-protein kinase LECRK3 n=1 Tax=Diospyros lotus TaxID=55363 RepID=UPI002254C18A|nr:G-type lectin S-receptor-like serine/threonine-protein kinase LECRK3 [Diospyros lotus]